MTSEDLQAEKAAARDKKRFARMTVDRVSCICEPNEVKDMFTGDDMDGCTLTDVWMTQAEYDALPEFEGW